MKSNVSDKKQRKRGTKICECGATAGARAYECSACGTEFATSKLRRGTRKRPVKDYRKLVPGDRVKVLGSSGPYYVGETGERTYMTDRGVYVVDRVDVDGVYVVSKMGARSFLYMGPERKSPNCHNLVRSPHRLILIVKGKTE